MSAAPDSRPVTAGTSPLDAVTTRFQHAAATSGVVERAYVIAGRSVTMRFAGTAMLDRLSGSFSHLLAEHRGERALRINIWDSSSTSTEAPPVLGDASATDASGAIYYFQDDSVRAITRWETLSVYDSATHEAWFWAPEAARMLSWDWAAPMRAIFHWWLGERGMIQVHGGAVGIEAGGALVVEAAARESRRRRLPASSPASPTPATTSSRSRRIHPRTSTASTAPESSSRIIYSAFRV